MGHLHAVYFSESLCPDVSVSVLWQDFPHKRASARVDRLYRLIHHSAHNTNTAQPAPERNYTPFINNPNIYSVFGKSLHFIQDGDFKKEFQIPRKYSLRQRHPALKKKKRG